MLKSQTPAPDSRDAALPSHLFYLSSLRRPLVDRAEGIYIWTQDGRRFIDGSSGPMVANIGHSNRNVLDAMKRQMDQRHLRLPAAFRERAGRGPGTGTGRKTARGPGPDLLRLRRFGSDGILRQAGAAMGCRHRTGQPLEGDHALSLLSWRHARLARRHRRRCAGRNLYADDAGDADSAGADRLARPRQSLDGTARHPLRRHAGGEDPR